MSNIKLAERTPADLRVMYREAINNQKHHEELAAEYFPQGADKDQRRRHLKSARYFRERASSIERRMGELAKQGELI